MFVLFYSLAVVVVSNLARSEGDDGTAIEPKGEMILGNIATTTGTIRVFKKKKNYILIYLFSILASNNS